MHTSSPRTSSTFGGSSPPRETKSLDLSSLPPVYVLPTHLSPDELHSIEDQLEDLGAPLTYDIQEAKLVLGTVGTKKRAELELRTRKLWTEEIPLESGSAKSEPPRKRARFDHQQSSPRSTAERDDGSTTEDEGEKDESQASRSVKRNSVVKPPACPTTNIDFSKGLKVLKLQWLSDSIKAHEILPIDTYLVYHGQKVARPPDTSTPKLSNATLPSPFQKISPNSQQLYAERPQIESILERAKADAGGSGYPLTAHYSAAPHGARRFRHQDNDQSHRSTQPQLTKAQLLATTTSEYDGNDSDIPPAPEWVKKEVLLACQRVTLANPPNKDFIHELEKIKLARLLTGDEVGVRAYSSSIASIAAYEYKINHPREILRLPACEVKIANLWIEWKNTGEIAEAKADEEDETLQILKLFYDIWGVGATTARDFCHDKGWRDIDDVIEFGWNSLSRVQQIGVKYYDEFKLGIPRAEVELIASKIEEHCVKIRDSGIETIVVGGYRRGKEESGDVDIIVSHRDLDKTLNLVNDIVASLEVEGWITHTLLLSLTTSHRGQSTLPFKSSGVATHGAGFDSLDKALVVWQDPNWPTKAADLARNLKAKNPNPHRRVDIIISPWRTVGCAILGWSGGTTFQRDLRRYVRKELGWKFDSSGVRDRATGLVVQLEGENGVEGGMVDAEKAVFRDMRLEYREPWERCTG
ncbi:Nucleotidyltransferase [Tothia fuscella]|uniref:DNA polymerase n=1 Tax=Tothia fuscella TaxID=1048955 RepID=A0A9P4TVB7_9PEZI|nr:Nucleotidyltransferase [Tothia fuscella]